MNLIQIQDKLKSLPNDPRVMQMLTAYANGQNPQVPPYLALGELNRRKVLMEEQQAASAGQPPGGTVKDQIQQQTGVMALQQGRQQQAMQQMAQQAAAGVPVPQGIAQPQGMAAGGLASLRPGYRSGGIIAFQEAGSVDEALEKKDSEGGGEGEAGEKSTDTYPADPRALMAQLMQEVAKRRSMGPPSIEGRDKVTERLIKENPDRYGILNKPIGEDAMARLEELQSARRAELAKQKEELAASKPGILQLLGKAAMDSRGQKGSSALASILGGYSELSSGATAKQLQQEQALRARELELQQVKADVLNKIDDAKRAKAEGNLDQAYKDMADAQRIANAHNISINTLLGKQLATAGTLVESQRKSEDTTRTIKSREDVARERRKLDERLENIRSNRPGEKERILRQVDRLRKDGKTEEADQLMSDIRYMQGGGSGVGQARNDRVAITELIRSLRLDLRDAGSPEEEAAIRAEIADLNQQLKNLVPKSDKVKPTATPQPLPSGITKENASKLLKVGTVYETAAGPGKWNGTGFDSVK